MPTVTLGTRRLYDALGVETTSIGQIQLSVELAIDRTVTVYLGPQPPLGIIALEGDQFGIPGRSSLMMRTNNEYESLCFLELAISTPREISPEQLRLIKEEDKQIREALLQEAQKNAELSEHLLDVVSGVLGLRVHRQLVLKPLVESAFLRGEFQPVSSFTGPAIEMLEGIQANSKTEPHLGQLLEGIKNAPEEALRNGGAVLHWLLKAWRERDAISQFMYLFIPLEAILPAPTEFADSSQQEIASLEAIVRSSGVANKESLLAFLDRAKTRFGPTLSARFEELARQAAIPGWELDVRAFQKYNRMRNLLLHAGNKNVRSHISFEENTRTLEDLVERYVSFVLLGTASVYPSRWRPTRETAA